MCVGCETTWKEVVVVRGDRCRDLRAQHLIFQCLWSMFVGWGCVRRRLGWCPGYFSLSADVAAPTFFLLTWTLLAEWGHLMRTCLMMWNFLIFLFSFVIVMGLLILGRPKFQNACYLLLADKNCMVRNDHKIVLCARNSRTPKIIFYWFFFILYLYFFCKDDTLNAVWMKFIRKWSECICVIWFWSLFKKFLKKVSVSFPS